jgi:hypothetical protein
MEGACMMSQEKILKASGNVEEFDRSKILDSMMSAGLDRKRAQDVIDLVARKVKPPLSTKKIYQAVRKYLRASDPGFTMKYSLKQAIYALGPTGYPFERFIGRILEADGFHARVGQMVDGTCVSHEVDVLAHKDKTCYVVECKFHHNGKVQSNVKTALYVHARYLDIVNNGKACQSRKATDIRGMIATNTRFTSEAIKYAECVGLEALAWKYPKGGSLENLIDRHKTYPVTVIPSVNRSNIHVLLNNDIVLARDVDRMGEEAFIRATGIPRHTASRIYRQACSVCE